MSLGPIYGAIDVAMPPHEQPLQVPATWTPPTLANAPGADPYGVPHTDAHADPYADPFADPYVDSLVDRYAGPWVAQPDGQPHVVPAWPSTVPTLPPAGELPLPPHVDDGIGGPPLPPVPHTAGGEGLAEHRGIESLSLGDHMAQSVSGWLLPSVAGGAVGGLLAAASLPAGSGRALTFGLKLAGGVAGGLLTGVGAGLLVSASSPRDGDSLAARYAVAAGALGAAGGAMFPGPSRALSTVMGGVSSAIVGGFVGHGIQQRAEGT